MRYFKNILIDVFLSIIFLVNNIYTLTWPIPEGSPGRYSITSTLGEYRSATRTHEGIDIGVSYCPVVSPVNGVITQKKENDGAAGNWLEINGIYRFFHLNNDSYFQNVYEHMPVYEGERVATSGESGSADGHPHLHFEILNTNPLLLFSITDTYNGSIRVIYFRHGNELLPLTDGMIFNRDNPFPSRGEFIVNAYDVSNTGRNRVNFYRIVSILDGEVLKDWEFNVSHTNEASFVYSISNPTSTRSEFWYRMGDWSSNEGKLHLR